MTTLQQKIAVMQAFADGKTIEACRRGGEWFQCEIEPCWDWTVFEYRVKREPREWWVNEYKGGMLAWHASAAEADEKRYPVDSYHVSHGVFLRCVHVREVID